MLDKFISEIWSLFIHLKVLTDKQILHIVICTSLNLLIINYFLLLCMKCFKCKLSVSSVTAQLYQGTVGPLFSEEIIIIMLKQHWTKYMYRTWALSAVLIAFWMAIACNFPWTYSYFLWGFRDCLNCSRYPVTSWRYCPPDS